MSAHGWAVLVLLIAGGYLVSLALYPYTSCGWCNGGKRRPKRGKVWGKCRHCGGSGNKPRLGRRLLWGDE